MSVQQEFLTTREAAGLAGFSPAAFNQRRLRGNGPPFTKLGHRCVRYRRQDVLDWLATNAAPTKTPAAAPWDPDEDLTFALKQLAQAVEGAFCVLPNAPEARAQIIRVAGLQLLERFSALVGSEAAPAAVMSTGGTS